MKIWGSAMFQTLSNRFAQALKQFRGQTRITENNIEDTLREIRMALLEADVALSVVKAFITEVKQKALGTAVANSLNPEQAFIKILYQELTAALGEKNISLNFKTVPPAVILVAGLQGSGKTTTLAKLANYLKQTQKKSMLLASGDVYRPAAREQLETLVQSISIEFFKSSSSSPVTIAEEALEEAKKKSLDLLLFDTAGRLSLDQAMMREIQSIYEVLCPIETLFILDSMMGQTAVEVAKAFDTVIPLTGIILSKTDGDARGGAAFSVRYTLNKPIKFIGTGEKIEALELFHPERLAKRILGMEDILSAIEKIQQHADLEATKKIKKKLLSPSGLDLQDFKDQLEQLNTAGGWSSLAESLPGLGSIGAVPPENKIKKMIAIINSMTLQERRHPDLIKFSRKQRIANGSGTTLQDINELFKQFLQLQKMMKKFKKTKGRLGLQGFNMF